MQVYIWGQYNKGAGSAPTDRAIQTDNDGNLIITPLAGSTFDVNITKIAGHAASHNSGTADDGTIRVTQATDVILRVSKDASANAVSNPIAVRLSQDGTSAMDATHPIAISATLGANAVTNPIFTQLSQDGTSAVDSTHPVPISATTSANAAANPVYVRQSVDGTNPIDGTHPLPISKDLSVNASSNPIAIRISQDGTDFTSATKPIPISATMGQNTSLNPIFVEGTTSSFYKPQVTTATGSSAINKTTAVAAAFRLLSINCKFTVAPATSENFTITKDSVTGSGYDTVIKSFDPGALGSTDLFYYPEGELYFCNGDEVIVTYTNTDARNYSLEITYMKV